MSYQRGDVVMTRIPHTSGDRGKKRPAVIVQADPYNIKLRHFIVAEITTNLAVASDAFGFRIDISTPDGIATGLSQDSAICCLFLATVGEGVITQVIGSLSPNLLRQLDDCLKTALQIT
ncbi:MAG: type II toxin-antitoxin system PemK/MazF family toxin [Gemmataceae bacterium]|nr:type II toxin-antitoxin system PemK/MazF family toxin [Gemmataceae bacterium]